VEKMQIATIGSFCQNEACEKYKIIDQKNMTKYGKTEKGVQRYQCKTCKKVFAETKGTMFYRFRHSEDEIIECMTMVGDRSSSSAIHRSKGIKEETVINWLERANDHVEEVEEYLMRTYKLSRLQIDALWTFVGHKGEKGGILKKL
jgi:transposase-like protein